jgi:hypothetical protein
MPPRDSKKLHFFGVSSSSGLPEDPRLQEFSVSVPNVSLVQANLGAIADMAAHWDGWCGNCSRTNRKARLEPQGYIDVLEIVP